MDKSNQKFWMVWNQNGRAPALHRSRKSAQDEAERLARAVPGGDFYVLEAVSHSRVVDVVTTPIYDGPELPF